MLFLFIAGMIGYQEGSPTEQVEYLRLAYKANKDAFTFGTFRFEFTRGKSASLSDAEAGVFSKSVREDGFFAFDGKNARYELIADPRGLVSVTTRIDERKGSSLASTSRTLTDGNATLLDLLALDEAGTSLRHGRAEIYKGSSLFYDDVFFQFPLLLGTDVARPYDLFRDLTQIKKGTATLEELDFDCHLDGVKVCKIKYRFKEGRAHLLDRREPWLYSPADS